MTDRSSIFHMLLECVVILVDSEECNLNITCEHTGVTFS